MHSPSRQRRIDLRGFEVVRIQLFTLASARYLVFTGRGLRFSAACIRALGNAACMEALIHPARRRLVVRECPKESRHAMRWAVVKDGIGHAREIGGAAYINTLREIFGLSPEYRYRFRGSIAHVGGERIIEFDMADPEIIGPNRVVTSHWGEGFGPDYYQYAYARVGVEGGDTIEVRYIYNTEPDVYPTAQDALDAEISRLIDGMKGGR